MLVDVDALIRAYFEIRPDPKDPAQRVAYSKLASFQPLAVAGGDVWIAHLMPNQVSMNRLLDRLAATT